ncbi:MAG: hypothetical protein EZS28_040483 [Streblomastix strix]|uniref:Uncharacterized protein n=1 Tax=Streblomastix strix TaxID=222440 RepID=A0A5J4U1E6_9EUKA|nr:MAG: hypothetical protein EZS28_040483 [Streblomastix strix]
MELNMDSNPRTLTYFIDDVEQMEYVTNIPAAVRFFAVLFYQNSSFKIERFDRLSVPYAKHEGSQEKQWGQH